MTEAWKTWEGQTVDGFALRQYLGGSDHSAVYLTQLSSGAQNAAIKLIPADATADARLASWRVAGELTHPHLLQLIRMGRCNVADTNFLYVVMEHAEEDLSQILPQRALDPEEARQLLQSIVNALKYLHRQGLAHTRLKPTNVLAIGDQLKISSDTLCEMGSALAAMEAGNIYAAPEAATSPVSPAGDIWSLGVTLVEALTQHTPVVRSQTPAEIPSAETIPAPFLEIARRSLELDPARRASLQQIAGLLNPDSVSPQRDIAAVSPLSTVATPATTSAAPVLTSPNAPVVHAPVAHAPVPHATVPHAPVSPATVTAGPVLSAPLSSAEPPKKSLASQQNTLMPRTLTSGATARGSAGAAPTRKSRTVVPMVAAVLVLGAILATPRVVNRFSQLQPQAAVVEPSTVPAPASLETPPKLAEEPAKHDAKKQEMGKPTTKQQVPDRESAFAPSSVGSSSTGKSAGDKQSRADKSIATRDVISRETTARDTTARETTPPRETTARPSKASKADVAPNPAHGSVLFQVMPDVSQRARSTIRGTVRISLKLHVDPAGDVVGTDLENDGSSRFFAEQAEKVAKRWTFTPPEVDGRAVPSEWVLRFEFSPKETKVFPSQINP